MKLLFPSLKKKLSVWCGLEIVLLLSYKSPPPAPPPNRHLSGKLRAAMRVVISLGLVYKHLAASIMNHYSFCGLISAVTFPTFHPSSTAGR